MSALKTQPMLSFIVPAHNEERLIERCIVAIRDAMQELRNPFEIVVVDDASNDATARIAQESGARVVPVRFRQISATRNAGAREARGEVFVFVDADTFVSRVLVASAIQALMAGAVGGGCAPRFDGPLPLWWRIVSPVVIGLIRALRMPGGACQFCTREAFEQVGGFSEAHFAAEDALFTRALKRQGRFVVLREPATTSGRSLRTQSWRSITGVLLRFALLGPDGFRRRQGLDVWYAPKRE